MSDPSPEEIHLCPNCGEPVPRRPGEDAWKYDDEAVQAVARALCCGGATSSGQPKPDPGTASDEKTGSTEPVVELVPAAIEGEEAPAMAPIAEGSELALLRFFRDLLENERLRILIEMDAISTDSNERMTQGVERRLFDWLARQGRLPEVTEMIDRLIAERKEGEA